MATVAPYFFGDRSMKRRVVGRWVKWRSTNADGSKAAATLGIKD